MTVTNLENQLDLAERIRKRWQPDKREDSAVYYGPLIDADKTYEGARNDVLDLLDVVATLQAELAECRQMCQRLATEGNQGGLTAAELKALASAAEVVAIQLCDPRDHTGGLLKIVDKAKAIAVRMEARDDSG